MSQARKRLSVWAAVLVLGACADGSRPVPTSTSPTTVAEAVVSTDVFSTLAPDSTLPTSAQCAEAVRDRGFGAETFSIITEANSLEVDVSVDIDGASEETNARFSPRVVGDFTGTTEEILAWGACKWGFDEDITRARAVTESSWKITTFGDETDDPSACALMGLEAPCHQSYGLLQVKGSVHLGTYPYSKDSTAFGVDYAMAWLRSCYEGSFTWLDEQGYSEGDEWGCVGAWFSGNWYDDLAEGYIAEVQGHLQSQTWLDY